MQNPLVSVVIPCKNSARTIWECLKSIKEQTYSNIEIIVVDNFSDDDTVKISSEYTSNIYIYWPERSAQRNHGVNKSNWQYVLIIDSDMKLSPDVVKDCIDKILSDSSIKWLVIPEESFGEWFWAQCKKLERSFYVWVEWMEAARFFDREVFDEMWWYDSENIWTEDYDLPQRIMQKFSKACIWSVNSYIYHDEWKLSLWRTCQKKFYYAQRLDKYKNNKANQQNFSNQSNIIDRYKLFFRSPKKLFANSMIWLWMIYMKTCEMIFGGCGYILSKFKKIDNIYR